MSFPTLKHLLEAAGATAAGAKVIHKYLEDEIDYVPDRFMDAFVNNGQHLLSHGTPGFSITSVQPHGDAYVVAMSFYGVDLDDFSPGDSSEVGEITGEEATEVVVTFTLPATILPEIATAEMADDDAKDDLLGKVFDEMGGVIYRITERFNQTRAWQEGGWEPEDDYIEDDDQLDEIMRSKNGERHTAHFDREETGLNYRKWAQPGSTYDNSKRTYKRSGITMGPVGDWLDAMEVEPKRDIPKAMEIARRSEEYKKLMSLGFEDVTNKREATNGTFGFRGIKGHMIGDVEPELNRDKPGDPRAVNRRVLANGRITGLSDDTRTYGWRAKSPAPATAETEPDLSPVERLVSNYTRAFAQLYKVQEPIFTKAFKARFGKRG